MPPVPAIQEAKPEPVVAAAETMSMVSAEVPVPIDSNSATSAPAQPAISSNIAGNPRGSNKRGGVIPPSVLSKTEPAYPHAARQAMMQGTVVLKIQILENGRPGTVSVLRSSGHDILDEAALTAVQQWRFTPAKDRDSGRTVICYSTLPVSFHVK
jgi:protein TonB